MAITRPVSKTTVATATWGWPVTDEINRLTTQSNGDHSDLLAFKTPTWIPVTLASGFSPQPSFAVPAYFQFGQWVFLRGLIRNDTGGVLTSSTLLTTLPTSVAPLATFATIMRHSATINSGLVVGIDILSTGAVNGRYSASNSASAGNHCATFDGLVYCR